MSDRALQDELIRALSDASFRASAAWRRRDLADPERLERFARFLARHFYYERVVHFFKYSRALARVTGARPEEVLRSPAFDALLPAMVLGSRAAASAVARLVVDQVAAGPGSGAVPYVGDLLRYEEAMMVVEAGPRRWRGPDDATGLPDGDGGHPVLSEGTRVLEFAFDLPVVLHRLLQPWTEIPAAPAGRSWLLFTRSARGRVAVASLTEPVARVLRQADGARTLDELAADAGLAPEALRQTFSGLTELGAVRFSIGS